MTESINSTAVKSKRSFLPDAGDIIFFVILWLILHIKENMLLTDGSTGWHLVSGNYILQHHNIPHTDLMSHTFANKPWVAYEWLSDLFMSCLVKMGGLNLLTVVVACAIAFLILLLYSRCRQNNCNFAFASFLTIIGACVAAIHWLARPHIWTFFGVFIFATQLDRYYHGLISKTRLTLYLTLYMLIWVNTHPAFPLGLAIIGIYLISYLFDYLFFNKNDSTAELKTKKTTQIRFLSSLLVLNIVASLCNPYGYHLYSYISHYLFKTNAIIAATDEFLSPIFHGATQPALLELLFALAIIGLVITKGKMVLPDLLVYLLFAYMSLSAQRNMALYVIATLPIIARLYGDTEFNPQTGLLYKKLLPIWQTFLDKANNLNQRFSETEKSCSYHLLPILTSVALIIISINGGKAFGFQILNAGFDKYSKPTSTLTTIKQLNLSPYHGLALDNWGGIIRYQLDYPVFIDDRADFYGQDFYMDYGRLIQTSPGWQALMTKYQIDWVLMPKNNRLIAELKANPDWKLAAEDTASTLMVRKAKLPPLNKNLITK
jgi:hypothetical protein